MPQTATGELWRSTLRIPTGQYHERVMSHELERLSWKEKMESFGEYQVDNHAIPVLYVLEKVLRTYNLVDSILEIGPGWGNYTLLFASLCNCLTCVDISPDLLNYIESAGRKRGYSNIHSIVSSWECCTSSQHEVVFGYNAFYRMINIEDCLLKINRVATKLCIIGLHEMPLEPCGPFLEKEYGLPVYYNRMDYRILRQILSELGIEATLIEIPNSRTFSFKSLDQFADVMHSYISGPYDRQVVKDAAQYIYHLEDGKYTYHRQFMSGLLIWEPKLF